MEIGKLLQLRPAWAYEPCLYIVKQMAEGNRAHRCGASGTHLHKDADLVYGSDRAQFTGLLSRMNMYKNYWLPVKGTIYAALQIKKQLVAESNLHRVGEDSEGNTYNIDRGSHTLVLSKEKEFHSELDRRGLRWDNDFKNELFVPKKDVSELIAALRTIKGENMFVFDHEEVHVDNKYRGGKRKENVEIINTTRRTLPDRSAQPDRGVPTITLKLNRQAIQQLSVGNPQDFAALLSLIKPYIDVEETTSLSSTQIGELKKGSKKGAEIAVALRRSARIAAMA